MRLRHGVTLLEVLVAAVLLSIGLLGALEAIARSANVTRRVQDRSRALMVARSKMEEILKEPVLEIGNDRGEGVDQGSNYNWEAAVEQSQNPALVNITVIATNPVTGTVVSVSSLRRPDLDTLPEGASAAGAETGTDAATGTGAPAGGAGGRQ